MTKPKSAPKHASSKAKPKAKSAALREKELERKKMLLFAAKAQADRASGVKGKARPPEDVDPEEQADELAASVEVDPDAAADEVEEEPIADRKEVKDLLEVGRQKGFLTYDEVNDALPADIVSSDQIDDVMSMFGDNDIEIVDAQKAAQGTETKPTVAASEEQQAAPEEEEEKDEDDEPGGKSNDPVRLYLRKMGSVSLLTREGEVEIAKRIEEGEKEVLRALLACRLAVAEILEVGNKLKAGKLRVREVVKDAPDEAASAEGTETEAEAEVGEVEGSAAQLNASELNRIEQICKQIDRIRKYGASVDDLEEDVAKKKLSEVRKKEIRQEIRDTRI